MSGRCFIAPVLPLALAQLRGRASLVVGSTSITFRHPGMVRRPIRIERTDVHSVFVGRHAPRDERQAPEPQKLRQRLRRIDQRALAESALPAANSVLLPDLSMLWGSPNLVVVFRVPLPLGGDVRRGMGLANVLLRAHGPTPITYARGFVAEVGDEALAKRAFNGWPTASSIPADVTFWLRGGNRRERAAPPAADSST